MILLAVHYQKLAKAQEDDLGIKNCKEKSSVLKLGKIYVLDVKCSLFYDFSRKSARIYMPQPLQREIFSSLHGLSHPGIQATQNFNLTVRVAIN